MYKLTIVGGPKKGTSYLIRDGEHNIGRVPGNDIILSSNQVSKKHCVVSVHHTNVIVKDLNSANGTFVNGALVHQKELHLNDRISVGEFVLELRNAEGQVTLHQTKSVMPILPEGLTDLKGTGLASSSASAPPKTFIEKVKFFFDQHIINFVYSLNEKHEWRSILVGMFVIFTVLAAVLSVYPVLDRVQEKLRDEGIGRALLLARQLVDRNAPLIYERLESKVDASFIEKEPGVLSTYLIDMEGRILAPGRKLNQYLTDPNEAAFSAMVRRSFQANDSLDRKVKLFNKIVAVAIPLRIFHATSGRNVTVALGLVFFDNGLVLLDSGTEALTYIQAFILSAMVAVIIFFSLYRLTLRPLLSLNNDIDQVLKGSASSVTRKFKMEELSPLIDVVNAALQRLSSFQGQPEMVGYDVETIGFVTDLLKFASDRMTNTGVLLFSGDKRIQYINSFMEDITGIRNSAAVGTEIKASARDAAFASFVEDLLMRAPAIGQDPVVEDFEFSGNNYKMECLAFGKMGSNDIYVMTASKPG